ncbi:MAG: oligopeptide transport system substrate-binding protein [Acidobacteriota bacterium]|nr:oligopeptide transport system substrate-binding protein [Acidobacteriota bacterium]
MLSPARYRAPMFVVLILSLAAVGGGCFTGDEGESFYGRVVVPRAQEFRWSDGGLPRVFDPARAAAPPDTDAVRALYEGLTDYDPQTLLPVSAEAYRWESSKDNRIWTFYLREDARWSNGDSVTAVDYLRSWQRALKLGDDAPHASLMRNLLTRSGRSDAEPKHDQASEEQAAREPAMTGQATSEHETSEKVTKEKEPAKTEQEAVAQPTEAAPTLAVEAIGDYVLRVRLQRPDPDLPSLLAHPVFRPVHLSLIEAEKQSGNASPAPPSKEKSATGIEPIISNGAFRLVEATDERVVLERGSSYWNTAQIALERVRFVASRDAEGALSAYREGEVDAITNANLEPAGLKLLASYKDFRRNTYGALTYYDFNATRPPFDDPRVREALALAIDRKRLSEDTLGGSTVPAEKFLPPVNDAEKKEDGESFKYDPDRARRLLAEAGYPGGNDFPKVRLLVNRNDQHRQVAETIAEMWRSILGVETEIELKSWDEYETKLRAGEYDLAKRSTLMQTPDEQENLLAMFSPERFTFDAGEVNPTEPSGAPSSQANNGARRMGESGSAKTAAAPEILTEMQALKDVPAIPIYFASSFALVKPYVSGFDANLLDAYSIQRVRLDTNWQPPKHEPVAVVGVGR